MRSVCPNSDYRQCITLQPISLVFTILIVQHFLSVACFSQTFETSIAGVASVSARPSIFSDPLGHLHIGWVSDDIYGETLRYASNQSGDWMSRRVAGTDDDVNFVPVAVADKYGFGYISYRRFNGGSGHSIRYVTNKSLTNYYWSTTTQMSGGHFHETSIEVGTDQSIHVFAQEDELAPSASRIFYQDLILSDTVFDGISQYYSTTIDQNNDLHVVGYRNGNILYKKYSSGSWSSAVEIDQLAISTYQPSITCDIYGNLHVVFNTTNGIYYLNDTLGSWGTPVLTNGIGGIFPDVVVDENKKAHVAYNTAGSNGAVYYMNNMSGSWITPVYIATIETDGITTTVDVSHADSKIALDLKNSTVNIVYVQNGNQVTVSTTDDLELRSTKSVDISSSLINNDTTVGSDTIGLSDEGSTITILDFTVRDSSGDGNSTKIEEIVFQSGSALSDGYSLNDFFQSMSIDVSDGSSKAAAVYSSRVIAGTSGSIWKTIPEGGSMTFTLKGVLNNDLGGVMNKEFQLKVNGLNDVIIDNSGSCFSYASSNVVSDTIKVLGLSGSGTDIDPYLVNNLTDLYTLSKANAYWSSYIRLNGDIDASTSNTWNSGSGMSPIGTSMSPFTGNFDGNGKTVSNLYINRGAEFYIGFFGVASDATIENTGIKDVDITGGMGTGSLVGSATNCTISQCFTTGNQTGGTHNGGMVGYLSGSTVNNCYSSVNVTGTGVRSGGFVGANWTGSQINNSYSNGSVSGGSINGGFVAFNFGGTVNKCLWDTHTSGQLTSNGGTGKTTAEMKTQSTFTDEGWDLIGESTNGTNNIWSIDGSNNIGYPWLSWEGYPTVTNTWDGSESTDFMDKDNWSLEFIPNVLNDLVISSGGNQPTLGTGDTIVVNKLTLNNGAILSIHNSSVININNDGSGN